MSGLQDWDGIRSWCSVILPVVHCDGRPSSNTCTRSNGDTHPVTLSGLWQGPPSTWGPGVGLQLAQIDHDHTRPLSPSMPCKDPGVQVGMEREHKRSQGMDVTF